MRAPARNGSGGLTPKEHTYALESFRLVGKRLRAERLARERGAERGDDVDKQQTEPVPERTDVEVPGPTPTTPPRGRASAGRTMAGLPDRVAALASEVDHLEASALASKRHLQQAVDELSTVLACVVAELLHTAGARTDDAQLRAERLAFLGDFHPRIGAAHRHLVDSEATKPTDTEGRRAETCKAYKGKRCADKSCKVCHG